MRSTRFIFVEGLMGAGKTTLVETLVEHFRKGGVPAAPIWEGPTVEEPDQPLRISPTLPHPFAPWEDLSPGEYVAESLRRWRRFVSEHKDDETIFVCDGLLFHGNMTDLMLMGASSDTLQNYVLAVVDTLQPLGPLAIYLRRPHVAEALRDIVAERGQAWQDYQVNWKVSSPYGQARELDGYDGLVKLYTDYRKTCDSVLQILPIPVLAVEHTGDWTSIYRQVAAFLGTSFYSDV